MTKGQIEACLSQVVSKFEVEIIGRGPSNIRTIIIEDMIIIRQKGFLTPAEKKLAEDQKGIELVKESRRLLFEKLQDEFKEIIKAVIDVDIISVHSDVSTRTGEKVVILSLSNNIEKVFEKN